MPLVDPAVSNLIRVRVPPALPAISLPLVSQPSGIDRELPDDSPMSISREELLQFLPLSSGILGIEYRNMALAVGCEVLLDSHKRLTNGGVLLDIRPGHFSDGGIGGSLIHSLKGPVMVKEPYSILCLLA